MDIYSQVKKKGLKSGKFWSEIGFMERWVVHPLIIQLPEVFNTQILPKIYTLSSKNVMRIFKLILLFGRSCYLDLTANTCN